jgi:hypothetical protein
MTADTHHKLANVPVTSPNPVRISLVKNEISGTIPSSLDTKNPKCFKG